MDGRRLGQVYQAATQNKELQRLKWGKLGNGVREGKEGPAHAVREGVQQDPKEDYLRQNMIISD